MEWEFTPFLQSKMLHQINVPESAAAWVGNLPKVSLIFTSAPLSINICTTSLWPFCKSLQQRKKWKKFFYQIKVNVENWNESPFAAAQWSGENSKSSFALTFAPCAINNFTILAEPNKNQKCVQSINDTNTCTWTLEPF